MKLSDLKTRTQIYMRDTSGRRFSSTILEGVLNEAVDRVRSYNIFANMPDLNKIDHVQYLPSQYHYLLCVYASSRLFELDNDYYQAVQRRNEFENEFANLISKIECGEITIYDEQKQPVENTTNAIDYIKDEYFKTTGGSSEDTIIE